MPYTQLFYQPIAAPLVHNPRGLVNPAPLFPRVNLEGVYDSDSSESYTVDTRSASTRCDSVEVSRLLEEGSTSPVPQFVEVPSVAPSMAVEVAAGWLVDEGSARTIPLAEAVMQAKPLVVPLVDIGGCFWVIIAWQKNI
mgnify:FL=1